MDFNNKNSGGIGKGKQDIKNFKDELENKEFTHYNANEILQQYLSKRANIETVVGEEWNDAQRNENQMKENLDDEQYMDEGYVREMTQQKTRNAMDSYKKILQWRELQIQVQDIILKKQNELITRLKGKDLSRQVLEEMKEVFDQKFESDKEKLKVIQNTLNERLDNAKDNLNERIDDVEKREREHLKYTAEQINQLHQVFDMLEDKIEIEVERTEVPPEIANKIENETEKELHDEAKPEPEPEPEPEPQDEEESEEEEEDDYEIPRNWSDPETDTDPRPVENPEFGFTERVDVRDTSETDWKVLRALDSGFTTKSGIREHADTQLMAMPMQQLNKMVRNGLIDPENLPENLQEELNAEAPAEE